MSKAVELIKEGASSATKKIKGALKGDVGDLISVATLGQSDQIEKAGSKLNPFKLPEPPAPPGVSQANVAEAAPDVDLMSTESSRRTSGQAVGTRKLRIPLGGLR